ncbi:hypothetical protein IG631_17816 [Alternaria alternata]|nr:hypothetical protein IG631_17816 [Alternaria alternata]
MTPVSHGPLMHPFFGESDFLAGRTLQLQLRPEGRRVPVVSHIATLSNRASGHPAYKFKATASGARANFLIQSSNSTFSDDIPRRGIFWSSPASQRSSPSDMMMSQLRILYTSTSHDKLCQELRMRGDSGEGREH